MHIIYDGQVKHFANFLRILGYYYYYYCSDRFELTDILPEDVKSYDKLVPPVLFNNESDPFDYGRND